LEASALGRLPGRFSTIYNPLQEEVLIMSHYLTIKIQTDPVNDAFTNGNMGNELSRILKKYADSIKEVGESDLFLLDTKLYDYNGAPVGRAEHK
tara:strand:- start:759 stop:1040 length:282 start_codon:yes stop_codon:yes gene_type:complete